MCHIHAQNTVIIVRIRPPDIRNNRIIRHDPAGILCQQGDNLKLDLRQMDILSIDRYQMFSKIDRQSPCMEWALIKRRIRVISNFYLNSPIGVGALFLYCFVLAVPGDIVLCIVAAIIGKRMIPLIQGGRLG